MFDLRQRLNTRVNELIDPNQLSYAQIYYEIAKKLKLLDPSNGTFQFMSGVTKADWQENVVNEYFLANYLPMNSGPYFIKSENTLENAYFNFINTIVCPSMDDVQGYVDAKNNKQQMMDQLNNIDTPNALNAYTAWKQDPTDPTITTFDLWLKSKASGSWNTIIESDNDQIKYYSNIMASYVKAIQAPLTRAISNFDNASKVTFKTANGEPITVLPTSIHPDLKLTVDGWKKGQGTSVHIDSKTSIQQTSSWNVVDSNSMDFSTFFGGFSHKNNAWVYQSITTDSAFAMSIDLAGVLNFYIDRPNWFDATLFKMYWNGPYPNSDFGPEFFATDGILVLVPTQVLVAYGISATLTISNSMYAEYQESWNEFSEFKVGPFTFTIGSSGSKTITQNSNNTITLKLTDNSQVPMIVGIMSQLNKYY